MRRTLFLHIGCHRTATTSIQQFMLTNVDALMEQGLFYPLRVARHQKLMTKIFQEGKKAGNVAIDLIERADKQPYDIHTLMLSDEDICIRRDLTPLLPFKEHFDVKIIFSMRRQDLWLESWYFQNIKWQWNPKLSHCTFEEFLSMRSDFHWIHYDKYVSKLEELFGAENLILSVFEKKQMPEGPVKSLCQQIGLTDLGKMTDPQHMNSSMSAEMVEFIRHMPLDQFAPPERDHLRRAFEKIDRTVLGRRAMRSQRLIPHRERKKILNEYAPGNAALAKRHFGRKDLFLEPLTSSATPLAKLELPKDSKTVLERFVVPLFQHMAANGTISRNQGKK